MRCEKCGFTNNPTAKFCKQCGVPQLHTATSAPELATELPPTLDAQVPPVGGTLCPQCATPRAQNKRFCSQCRFDFMASVSAPITAEATTETRAPAKRQTIPVSSSETGGRGSRFWLIGGVAVLAIGIAGAAGYLLYEQHAKSSTLQAALSPSETIVTPQAIALQAGGKPQQAIGVDPAPGTLASGVEAKTTATVAEIPPATANTQAPPVANVASASVAAPTNIASQPIGQTVDNGATRAAIARNLADGNRCFNNNKFDCALSKANAALRLDPHNEQAASLLRRTKTVLVLPPYNRVFAQ